MCSANVKALLEFEYEFRPFHVLSFLVAKFSSVRRCSAIPHMDLIKLVDVHAGVACPSLVF